MNQIAAFYARVSTGRQEKEETIESQVDEIQKKIKDDGNILPETNRFIDDGWPGDILQRPNLDAMRDAASRKEFEVIYVYDRGRLSRKYAYQEVVIDDLQEKNIMFVTIHDVQAHTPEEHVLQAMQGVFHEYERIKIAERMRRGKLFKARSGKIVHGTDKYGWTYVYKTKEEDCHYVVNEKQAETLRQIFSIVSGEHLTIRQLIKRLYQLGIPSPDGNAKWANSTLSRILHDEAYIGTTYYNRRYAVIPKKPHKHEKYKKQKKSSRAFRGKEEWIAIPIPPIIDPHLFYKVQKQLDVNAQFSRRNKKHDYLLSGLAWCACSSKMFGEGSVRQYYYRCTDRLKTYPMPRRCLAGGVNIKRIENPVWESVKRLLLNPDNVRQFADEWLNSRTSMSNPVSLLEKEKLTKAIQKIEEEGQRYVKAYGEGLITLDTLKKNMSEINKRKSTFTKEMNTIEEKSKTRSEQVLPPKSVLEERLPQVLLCLIEGEKQSVLRKIVTEIIVNQERTSAKIRGHIPLSIQEVKEKPKYGLESICRDSWASKCWEIDPFQRLAEKASCQCCQLSVLHD